MIAETLYDITGSIVTYKTDKVELKRVIESFMATELNIKLYISDNSPTDEIKSFIESLGYQNIEYIFNNKNGGYGYGHNIVIKKILEKSKYHLILNPDIYFDKDVLEKIYSFSEENEDVGNVMPMVKYPNGDIQYLCKELPNPFVIFLRRFPLFKKLHNELNYKFEMKYFSYDKCLNAPILSGCFMFIRNKVFSQIGYFDEKFFMYFEDFDLNRRIHKNYRTIFFPDTFIVHAHAREAHKSKKMMFIGIKSAIYYFNKYGWFFDKERNEVNKRILKDFGNTKENQGGE